MLLPGRRSDISVQREGSRLGPSIREPFALRITMMLPTLRGASRTGVGARDRARVGQRVGPRGPAFIPIPEQARGDGVSVGLVADQDGSEVLPGQGTERAEQAAENFVTDWFVR